MAMPLPIDQPSRRTVEQLLKDIVYDFANYRGDRESSIISKELDALKDRLLDVPKVRALERKYKAACHREHVKREAVKTKVARVKRLYQAKGLTPAVRKEIEALVEEANEK